mgnify:CR=1 FL=1
MYNPHDEPDYSDEAHVMSKGRLVKVRFTDQAHPNVSWLWIPIGNCFACEHYAKSPPHSYPSCLNKKITQQKFHEEYIFVNTCPEFDVGVDPKTNADNSDLLDVMKAIRLVPGEPVQQVVVIVDEPWSITLAQRAHHEQSAFLDMARLADSGLRNDPAQSEYVDLSDDLEHQPTDTTTAMAIDASGHQHKGKGKGGGQFTSTLGSGTSPSATASAHKKTVIAAVRKLDKGVNLVSIVDLRAELERQGVTERADQDKAINELRRAGVLSMSGPEGRHALSDPEGHKKLLAASLTEGGSTLSYVSFRR